MRAIARFACRAVGVLAVTGAVVAGATLPASAHPADGTQTDAEHAATDLAGTPMTDIEAQTAANARKLAAATGTVPGRRTAATTRNGLERAAVRAATDPGTGGAWSAVYPTEVVPVFQAMLPSGKVLMWDSVGDGAAESYPNQTFTRAMVWDPSADPTSPSAYKRVDVQGYNIFCAGYTQLADGNVLVAGGNKDQALNGLVQTHLFDWRTETWSRGPDMASGRWYPSVNPLANGEALILGGGPTTAEVYQNDGTLRAQTGYSTSSNRYYPFLTTRPDTKVQYLGHQNGMLTIDTTGAGAITASRNRDGKSRTYGSFATYGVGKTLVAGGGVLTEDGQTNVPTKTGVVVATNATTTSVAATGSMAVGRRQFDLTVLADGSVLATGGMSAVADNDLINLNAPVFAAERWNPATGSWTTLAPASRVRQYHSTAMLLPDGRVITGGGGVCGVCVTRGYLEKNVEYFSPPYLFKADGTAADRPVISSAPDAVGFNAPFSVSTAQASSIRKVGMVRLGAPTHGDDQGQRYVPLGFKAGTGTLSVNAPANAGIAPPGYYMLFLADAAGVPSVAKIIRVADGSTAQATQIQLAGSTVCLDDPAASTTKGTRPQLYGCNSSSAQLWTPGADQTLRVVGMCLDITGDQRVPGTAVELWTCKANSAQRWTRAADQTIRVAATPSLCLGTVGDATVAGTRVELQTCDGRASQRWS